MCVEIEDDSYFFPVPARSRIRLHFVARTSDEGCLAGRASHMPLACSLGAPNSSIKMTLIALLFLRNRRDSAHDHLLFIDIAQARNDGFKGERHDTASKTSIRKACTLSYNDVIPSLQAISRCGTITEGSPGLGCSDQSGTSAFPNLHCIS